MIIYQGFGHLYDCYGDGRSYNCVRSHMLGVRSDMQGQGIRKVLANYCHIEAKRLGVPIRFFAEMTL